MSNTTTTKRKPSATAEQKQALAEVIVPNEDIAPINMKKVTPGAVRIDDSALINVKSNVIGELYFTDPVTRETIKWARCGEILQIPLATLRHMKNGAVKFFTNQLVIITGFADENAEKYEPADIYKALYITQYYNDIIDPSDYESICGWTPDEIRQKVPMLSAGSKGKLVVALNTYVEKGILDSLKAIKTFEEVLGCDLKRPE